jgi:hypothetical protein
VAPKSVKFTNEIPVCVLIISVVTSFTLKAAKESSQAVITLIPTVYGCDDVVSFTRRSLTILILMSATDLIGRYGTCKARALPYHGFDELHSVLLLGVLKSVFHVSYCVYHSRVPKLMLEVLVRVQPDLRLELTCYS